MTSGGALMASATSGYASINKSPFADHREQLLADHGSRVEVEAALPSGGACHAIDIRADSPGHQVADERADPEVLQEKTVGRPDPVQDAQDHLPPPGAKEDGHQISDRKRIDREIELHPSQGRQQTREIEAREDDGEEQYRCREPQPEEYTPQLCFHPRECEAPATLR